MCKCGEITYRVDVQHRDLRDVKGPEAQEWVGSSYLMRQRGSINHTALSRKSNGYSSRRAHIQRDAII